MKNRLASLLTICWIGFVYQPVMAVPVFSIVQTIGPEKLHAGDIGGFRLEVADLNELLGAFSVDVTYDASALAVTGNVIFSSALGSADPLVLESLVGVDTSVPGLIRIDQVSLLTTGELDLLQRDAASGVLRSPLALAAFLLTATGVGDGTIDIQPTNVVLSNDQGDAIADVQLTGTSIAVSEPSSLVLFLTTLVIVLARRLRTTAIRLSTIALLVVPSLGMVQAQVAVAKTVMPLGDSLTVGFGAAPGYGYRAYLRDMLESARFPIDYVGSQGSPPLRHEGATGFRIDQIAAQKKWKTSPSPDVILFMVGTNNFLQRYMQGAYCRGQTPSSLATAFADELESLAKNILADTPSSTQLLVGAIPRINARQASGKYGSCTLNAGLSEDQKSLLQNVLNSEIKAYNDSVKARLASTARVHLVDVGSTLQDPANDYYDGVHPKDLARYEVMAPAWFRALVTAFRLTAPPGGAFYRAVHFGEGVLDRPEQVVVGDVNRDGKLDLVIGDTTTGVNVLLGKGDGTFAASLSGATGLLLRSVAVGDVNRDGKLDLVVAGEATVTVLAGNGDGTFQSAVSYSYPEPVITGNHLSVAVADLNGDGYPDLAVANEGGLPPPAGPFPGSIAVFLNEGVRSAGSFAARKIVGSGGFPSVVTAGDVNGDGTLDLIVANGLACSFGCSDLQDGSTVGVLLGRGDGTFHGPFHPSVPAFYTVGTKPLSVKVADVNGDGKPDLVTANFRSHNSSVLLGRGDGTFGTAINFLTGKLPRSIAAKDLNGDSTVDLVAANFSVGTVNVLQGRGDGAFRGGVPYAVRALHATPVDLAVEDFNRDGRPDLVAVNSDIGGDGTGSLLLNQLLGDLNTNGCVDQPDLANLLADVRSAGPHNLAFDLNVDGRVDIADGRRLVTLFTNPYGAICP